MVSGVVMRVLCAPPAFLPLSSVRMMFSVPLGAWVFSVLQLHFYFFLCGKDVFCTSGFMNVLCAPAAFLPLPLWEGCSLYFWVHGCLLCSSSISTLSSVGRMFSILLGSWMFSVLHQHFYPFFCGKDVFCTSGFMSVLCAPAAFIPLPLWEGCFLYFWVHGCFLCSSSISTLSSVGRMFSVLLCSWVFSVLLQHFYPSSVGIMFSIPLGSWVFSMFSVLLGSWVFSVLKQHFYPFLYVDDVISFVLYLCVHGCSLCSSSISSLPSVGKVFSAPLGAWNFFVLYYIIMFHFYAQCPLGIMFSAPLGSWVFSVLLQHFYYFFVGMGFIVPLGVWMFFVFLQHFYSFLCGNYIFLHIWVHETSLCCTTFSCSMPFVKGS